MGGPIWGHLDDGAWSFPKGIFDPAVEEPLAAARREFSEEIGVEPPPGDPVDLGEFVQRGGKRVRAFALAVDPEVAVEFVGSNLFSIEWPRGSGVIGWYPEIDGAAWFPLGVARTKVLGGQVQVLDALAVHLRD